MSQSHKQTATDPAEGSIASHACRQTRIRSRDDDEEKQPAQPSTHVSPAMRVYRHALESIFAMLDLPDLTQVVAVSCSWFAAVRSMKPIGASICRDAFWLVREGKVFHPLPPISTLIASPLLRHVGTIEVKGRYNRAVTLLTNESLALLAQHAPNLTSLWCELTLTPHAPLILPPRLSSLQLLLLDDPSPAEANGVLTALSGLAVLQRVSLTLPTVAGVDFSLLGASPSLTDLTLKKLDGFHPDLSDEQVTQFRSSLGHLQRIDVAWMDSDNLARFLQPPVTARWQDLGWIDADAHTGELLATLPSLTHLDIHYFADAPHAHFLSQLPLLTGLMLDTRKVSDPPVFHITADALLDSMLPCVGLTELSVSCGFNSAQVSALLARLIKLRKLTVHGALETLRCFASGPATQTLDELELYMLGSLPLSELPQLFALQSLRRLLFWRCFTAVLDSATIDSLSPPCAILPLLTQLQVCWIDPDSRTLPRREIGVKRTGPSFEWMEARLNQ